MKKEDDPTCRRCLGKGYVKTGRYDILGEAETIACDECDAVPAGWDVATYNQMFRSTLGTTKD